MPTLEITTVVRCPLMCKFCPQDKLWDSYSDPKRALSFVNFKMMLEKVPVYVRIDFSGMSEPWANRLATEMLQLTLERGHNVSIYTTLQGMRDSEKVVKLLTAHASQVEAIVIHLPDAAGNMTGFVHTPDYDEAIRRFSEFGQIGLIDRFAMMTMNETNEVHPCVEAEVTEPWLAINRAGNVSASDSTMEEKTDISTPLSCSFTHAYDHNVLLPNGDVVLCCMDYSLKHKIGNLLKDGYFDLFRSKEMTRIRVENMLYGRGGTICRNCSRARPHDLGSTKQFWT